MSDIEKLFVVVDPSDAAPVALERVLEVSKLRPSKTQLKVFVAIDGESVDTRAVNDNLFRDQAWFEEVIRKPIEEIGFEYSIEVSWSHQWQESIVQSAKHFTADRIYLPVHARSNTSRFTFSESKWDLLKTAECPVVLIQPEAPKKRSIILAAVNFQAVKDIQKQLNTGIISWAKVAAETYGADLHVVNAYLDSMNYPDRGQLARQTGLPAEKIHVTQGYTDESVAKIAKEIHADLVVMGTLGQNGMTSSRRGNTASRVVAGLTQDIMVINSQKM
ncbi:universal stress protein [Agarilytica rhodophyticola]|uniref:universal stress protein n=1 Tax=Agarilytica rhodophyticola TaxID=1737490 RepID=UPI000B34A170|nr:universal stress protein [Agarilytica rhodophyticola]